MAQNLSDRLERLEDDLGPAVGVADLFEAARLRLRAMSPEAREAECRARYLHALNSEPPEGQLARRLWEANCRMARRLGLAGFTTLPTQ